MSKFQVEAPCQQLAQSTSYVCSPDCQGYALVDHLVQEGDAELPRGDGARVQVDCD